VEKLTTQQVLLLVRHLTYETTFGKLFYKCTMLYPYCVFPFWYDMHSRDTTVLIDLLLYNTPACFSTFFDLLWSLATLLIF